MNEGVFVVAEHTTGYGGGMGDGARDIVRPSQVTVANVEQPARKVLRIIVMAYAHVLPQAEEADLVPKGRALQAGVYFLLAASFDYNGQDLLKVSSEHDRHPTEGSVIIA